MLWRKIKWGKQIHGDNVFIVKKSHKMKGMGRPEHSDGEEEGMKIIRGKNIPGRVNKCSDSLASMLGEGGKM